LLYVVPAVLYALNNNLNMVMNQHMDPATEDVLVQGKILTTGLVWWLVFQKPLGARKCLSLVVLLAGAALAGLSSREPGLLKHMYIDTVGVFLVLTYISVSAGAAVYIEWLYKSMGKTDSIHVGNIRLYVIGILANLVAHWWGSGTPTSTSHLSGGLLSVFAGYNVYVWGLVAVYSSMGLLLAQVLKRFDNIVKVFINASSMYTSAFASWLLFGYIPTANFMAGLSLVTSAILLYNGDSIAVMLRKMKQE